MVFLLSAYYQNAKAQTCVGVPFNTNVTFSSPISFTPGSYRVGVGITLDIINGGIVTFTNSTIYMDPGSRFRLDGTGQLNFIGCIVRECTDTWEGIQLLSTSCSLSVTSSSTNPSTIRGADEAIVDIGGGTILLDHVNMEDNYMHVRLLGSSSTATSFETYGSKFVCDNTTIPNSNNPNYIGMPRTVHAIEVDNTNYRILGDGTSLAYRNEIRNADVGIWIFRTSCEIYNFFIWQTNERTLGNECGIQAACPIIPGFYPDLIVGGFNHTFDPVIIQQAENGIRVDAGYNMNIAKNIIGEISRFGIIFNECIQRDIIITDNDISLDYALTPLTQDMAGIDNWANNLANVTISRNTISLFGLPQNVFSLNNKDAHGIWIEDDATNLSNSTVTGNVIYDFQHGINAINSVSLTIQGNTVNMPNVTSTSAIRRGILADNCDGIVIRYNQVTSTWAFCSHRGIQAANCDNTFIQCNRIDKGGTQILLSGTFNNNAIPDGITGNGMHQGTVGLKVNSAVADLGTNGGPGNPADNHWEKNYTTGCNGGSGCVVLPSNNQIGGEFFCRDNPTTGNSVFDPFLAGCITNFNTLATLFFTQTFIPPNNSTVDWYCNNTLMRQGNRVAGDSSSVNEYVGYFNLVSKLKSMESYSIFSLNSVADYIVTNGIESTDSLYIQYLDLPFASDAILMCSIQNEITLGNLSNALELLSQSTFEGEAYQLLAYVLENQLLVKLNPETNLSESSLDSLRMIAHLCPYTYGEAVYEARVMMKINPSENDEDCGNEENQSLIRVIGKPRYNTTQVLEMYPNPIENGTTLTINNANYLIGSMVISNVLGQPVFQYSVYKEESEISFPINLIPGIYYLRVEFTNNTLAVQKLIVK